MIPAHVTISVGMVTILVGTLSGSPFLVMLLVLPPSRLLLLMLGRVLAQRVHHECTIPLSVWIIWVSLQLKLRAQLLNLD